MALNAYGIVGPTAVAIGAAVVLVLRLAAIYWKISLPVFQAREG